jgi:hypothetical protein
MKIYRETPGKIKMYLNRNQCSRLIGRNGKTINSLRDKYKKNSILLNTKDPKFYLEYSGENHLKIYRDIIKILF